MGLATDGPAANVHVQLQISAALLAFILEARFAIKEPFSLLLAPFPPSRSLTTGPTGKAVKCQASGCVLLVLVHGSPKFGGSADLVTRLLRLVSP